MLFAVHLPGKGYSVFEWVLIFWDEKKKTIIGTRGG
jgi:hypothetical protein